MQAFVEACRAAPSFSHFTALLPIIVDDSVLHARFLNTLSRLEYVGVRKMLKARRADCLDLEGLQHIVEEAVHALRLKKFAHSLNSTTVNTYVEASTLAGSAAEDYFQQVDRACLQQLLAVEAIGPDTSNPAKAIPAEELAYLLTSTAIEVRAHCLYPAYQSALRDGQSKISVASILSDEERHLEQMAAKLPAAIPDWRRRLAQVLIGEEQAFATLVQAWTAYISQQKLAR